MVGDCHRKLAKWLCENYRVILLPEFPTKAMVDCKQRRINSKTARAICTWSHFRFRQHLVHKAREFPWCDVVVCTEEYTSKTCSKCGWLHTTLGGSKVFRCSGCNPSLIETSMEPAIFFLDTLRLFGILENRASFGWCWGLPPETLVGFCRTCTFSI